MKPLQSLLSAISGKPASKRLLEAVAKIQAEVEAAHASFSHIGHDTLAAERAPLIEAWRTRPTPAAADALLAHDIRIASAPGTVSTLTSYAQDIRSERMNKLRSLFDAALAEVYAGFDEQRTKIETDDARRSEELGVPCESTAALQMLARKREMLERGVLMRQHDLPGAINALTTALTPEPKRRPETPDVRSHPEEDESAFPRTIQGARP